MAGVKSGKALRANDFPAGTRARIMSHTVRRGRCRVWTGCTNSGGHPTITIERTQHLARRVLYALECGECPASVPVSTTCRNPLCLAPAHLQVFRVGGRPTTTTAQAKRIRALRHTHSMPAIAEILGVGVGAVENVCHNRPTHGHHDPDYQHESSQIGKRTRSSSRLTDADVRAARRAVARGRTIASEARRYGVAYSTMHYAVSGRTFQWVKNP